MAEIKIYGTLVNDTAEAIARTTQVIDPATGKNVNEMIEAAKASAKRKPWLTAFQANGTAAVDLTQTKDWASVTIPLAVDEQGVDFPNDKSSIKLRDYCGIVFENSSSDVFFFPFSYLYDDSELTGSIEFMPVLGKNLEMYRPYMDYVELYRPYMDHVDYPGTPLPALKFKKLELGSDSGLTPWQKAYLEGLEKQEVADKFAATIMLSQTQKDFDGTATTVTVYVTPKFDGSNVDAVVTGTSSNLSGKTFTKGSDGRYSTQVTLNAPASVSTSSITETFSVMVKYTHPTAGQLTKSLSATHTQNIKSYILKEATDAIIINDLATRFGTAWKSANSLKGTHSIPIASGGEWVFLVVPKTGNGISKVTSSGFDVPMTSVGEDVSVTKGSSTIHYMVIRTSSKPQSTPFNIVIS